jgi:hypothetical protein
VKDIVHQLCGGLASGISYCGAFTIPEMQQKARFVKITVRLCLCVCSLVLILCLRVLESARVALTMLRSSNKMISSLFGVSLGVCCEQRRRESQKIQFSKQAKIQQGFFFVE